MERKRFNYSITLNDKISFTTQKSVDRHKEGKIYNFKISAFFYSFIDFKKKYFKI